MIQVIQAECAGTRQSLVGIFFLCARWVVLQAHRVIYSGYLSVAYTSRHNFSPTLQWLPNIQSAVSCAFVAPHILKKYPIFRKRCATIFARIRMTGDFPRAFSLSPSSSSPSPPIVCTTSPRYPHASLPCFFPAETPLVPTTFPVIISDCQYNMASFQAMAVIMGMGLLQIASVAHAWPSCNAEGTCEQLCAFW